MARFRLLITLVLVKDADKVGKLFKTGRFERFSLMWLEFAVEASERVIKWAFRRTS